MKRSVLVNLVRKSLLRVRDLLPLDRFVVVVPDPIDSRSGDDLPVKLNLKSKKRLPKLK